MKRSLLAMFAVLGLAISATAQQGGGGGGGGTGGAGGGQGGGGGGGQQLQTQQNTLSTLDFSNTNAGLATIGTATTKGGAISTSNAFGPYMANPLYPGRPGSTALDIAKGSGGFGVQTFGTGTSTGNTTGGRGAATTTTGGRAGGARGGSSTNTFIGSTTEYKGGRLGYGQAPQIAYTATLKFAAKPIVHTEVSGDLQGLFNRSTMLSNKSFQAGVDGQTIVLRGKAKDMDEKMLVEGMARLTPGVREIRNEIEVP